MDKIYSQIRYDGLMGPELQAHLQHCARNLGNKDYAEFLLCEAGVVVPIIKRKYATKPATLVLALRSGSVGRDSLASLRAKLESAGYDLKVFFTRKQQLLRRIEISVSVDDPMLPLLCAPIFHVVASELNSSWPQKMAVGYDLGMDRPGLPGQATLMNPMLNASRKLGRRVGELIGRLLS